MTLLGALVRSNLEDPRVPLSSAEAGWGPPVYAGVNVTEDRAYGLTAYFRGVAILSSTLAMTPLKVYRRGSRVRATFEHVIDNPNPAQTPFEFRQTIAANAITWGTGFSRKYRSRSGIVAETWSIHPSNCRMVKVAPTPANPEGRVFEVTDLDGTMRELTTHEITAIPYLSPHGGAGMRPLQLARQVLGVNIAAEETAAKFFGKGTMLSGILRTDKELSEQQATRLKRRWGRLVQGQENVGEIAVLDSGAEFTPVTIPPADAELLASRKFGVSEVARLLGIPPHLLMDVEKSTSWGTGIEQQQIALVVYTLQPWFTLFEQRISREWLPGDGYYAEYAIEGLLRGDSAARAAWYKTMREIGAYTIDDVLTRENEEKMGGEIGGSRLLPSNMAMVTPDGRVTPVSQGLGIAVDESGNLTITGGQVTNESDARALAEIIQKVYLGVDVVLSADEAREIVNRAGAGLTVPWPQHPTGES